MHPITKTMTSQEANRHYRDLYRYNPWVSNVTDNGLTFKVGRGFYEFTKTVEVQAYKEIILSNDSTGAMWTGMAARTLLGLPDDRTIKLAAGTLPGYTVFIQSTSNNRKLLSGTKFLYEVPDWEHGI